MEADTQKTIDEKWGIREIIEQTIKSYDLHSKPSKDTLAKFSEIMEILQKLSNEFESNREKIVALEKADIVNAKEHQDNLNQHKEILAQVKKSNEIIEPIAETYKTANKISKLGKAFLLLLALVLGLFLTIKQLFNISW